MPKELPGVFRLPGRVEDSCPKVSHSHDVMKAHAGKNYDVHSFGLLIHD